MTKPIASLSLDLDNLWSYMKTHGDPGWETFPTYLPRLVPLVLDWLARHGQKITFMVVGQDAAQPANREALAALAAAGHEVGNHSFHHEPWMQYESVDTLTDELLRAENAIATATGARPIGFRGPGFCSSPALLQALCRLDYHYDASLLPSVLGPLARCYYLWTARMERAERNKRAELFGRWRDGFNPLRPFIWTSSCGELLEIPVSTIPVLRVPFHLSYILWLSGFSTSLAMAYLRLALTMCRLRGVQPSFLLHPLDFLGAEDAPELMFFPGMRLPREHKMALADRFLDLYRQMFDVLPLGDHMRRTMEAGAPRRAIAEDEIAPEKRAMRPPAAEAKETEQIKD